MSVFAEFTVPASAIPLARALGPADIATVEIERVVPVGRPAYFLWLVGPDRGEPLARLGEDEAVAALETVDELPDRTLVRCEWTGDGGEFLPALDAANATLLDARLVDGTWEVDVRLPDREALAAVFDALDGDGGEVVLTRLNETVPDEAEAATGLTSRQAETLGAAIEAGYFEVPRAATIGELADQLGVTEQAVSERLRRGLATIIAETIGQEATDEPDDRA
ncbi:MAG: helix-turn-helix domain-containing protein [Haloarculaceae archaeon]